MRLAIRHGIRRCDGFSLIEAMVASVIMGMAITGVLSLLGMGATLETENALRLQARMFAANALEQEANHYKNFGTVGTGTVTVAVAPGLTTSSGANVPANLTTVVTLESYSWRNVDGIADIVIPFKRIRSTVTWTFAGRNEAVSLEKSIAELKK